MCDNGQKGNPQKSASNYLSQESQDEHLPTTSRFSTWSALQIDLAERILDLTGSLQQQADSIRGEGLVEWRSYLDHEVIGQDDYDFISAFQSTHSRDERCQMLDHFQDQAFTSLKDTVQKVNDVEDMKKFLLLIEDMIWEDPSRVNGFLSVSDKPWENFTPLLQWEDDFIRNCASRIIATMFSAAKVEAKEKDLRSFLEWLKNELKTDNPYLQSVARCLQKVLRQDDYRAAFMTLNGIFRIVKLLSNRLKLQAQYQFSFCLWMASFNPYLAEKLNRSGIIPIMAEVLKSCPSEVLKLPRMVVATFRNLLEKPRESGVRKHNALVMIQCKLPKFLQTMQKKIEDCNDPEFTEDYEVLEEILNSYVAELSSFDEYYMELKSGRLEWSMVHTSKKFWVKNAERLNENRHELIKVLISMLDTSKDNVVLCISAHDLGEYMKQYSRGKKVVEDLGGKSALVRLLKHRHPSVKYYALKTLQILMLNNYELFSEYHSATKDLSEDRSRIATKES